MVWCIMDRDCSRPRRAGDVTSAEIIPSPQGRDADLVGGVTSPWSGKTQGVTSTTQPCGFPQLPRAADRHDKGVAFHRGKFAGGLIDCRPACASERADELRSVCFALGQFQHLHQQAAGLARLGSGARRSPARHWCPGRRAPGSGLPVGREHSPRDSRHRWCAGTSPLQNLELAHRTGCRPSRRRSSCVLPLTIGMGSPNCFQETIDAFLRAVVLEHGDVVEKEVVGRLRTRLARRAMGRRPRGRAKTRMAGRMGRNVSGSGLPVDPLAHGSFRQAPIATTRCVLLTTPCLEESARRGMTGSRDRSCGLGGTTVSDSGRSAPAGQVASGTIVMAPQGHSETQMPQPLQ